MDHFTYKNSVLHAEDVALSEIAAAVGTPFYCYSTATLQRHYRIFKDALAELDPLICYAVKANTTMAVLKTLAQEGSGADVVSEGEIKAALAAGIPREKIVFSGVGKTHDEMAYALSQGIFQFNVESEPELYVLSQVAHHMGKTANIALRVNPDVIPDTHAKISTGQKESKFGVPFIEATALYAKAAKLPGIGVQGVSVHIGSQLTNLAPFASAFARVVELVRELRAAGHQITTLDLGGGLGIPYGNQAEPPLPAAYADIVKEATKGLQCKLIFEPGRLIAGNAGILVSRVIYVKHSESRVFVIVDAGMNDLMRPTLYSAYHDIVPVKASDSGETETVDVVGPVCETGDIFASARLLRVPESGDLLAFRSAGAYGASMASTYNSRPLLAEVMVNGEQYAVVRLRQTYEELLKRDRIPDWL
ncbi:MAG TPA: diaminopimelate decarboxylase [Rickettsiales bacterium]|nr:diaminopimelate decarboxylase [Rickettsiales bacterium]